MERAEDGVSYRLGLAVLRLGFEVLASMDLTELGHPVIEELRDLCGYSAHLVVRDAREVVFIAKAAGRNAMFHSIQVGARLPAHGTVLGRILLSDLDQAQLRALYGDAPLQAFTPMEPVAVSVDSDEHGVNAEDLRAKVGTGADKARFVYLLPNFQNPTGRTMTEERRAAVAQVAIETGLPIIEDNPYGDLWFDAPPAPSLSSRHPEGSVYLGSFSKILAPGLRLGYLVAPKALYPKLLQAKQAADLHTPSFNQRVVAEVLKDGFIDRHVPTIRALYKRQCEAMLDALTREMAGLDVTWNRPAGGMFLWARLPAGMDAVQLLPKAVDKGVAFVPGAAFYAAQPVQETLRLSFVTSTVEQIQTGVAALAQTIRDNLPR